MSNFIIRNIQIFFFFSQLSTTMQPTDNCNVTVDDTSTCTNAYSTIYIQSSLDPAKLEYFMVEV